MAIWFRQKDCPELACHLVRRHVRFKSQSYWDKRYRDNCDSGDGSYGKLAAFKADFVNKFVSAHRIESVIDFGCGDGAQLDLLAIPQYVGVDVSLTAVEACRMAFADDYSKCFLHHTELSGIGPQEMSLSMDVIFHLVENEVYKKYMHNLFRYALRYVVIYSSSFEEAASAPHVRHRDFVRTVRERITGWHLVRYVANPFRFEKERSSDASYSDFFVYQHV
jgi:SAM-dependent methyltransferase